MSLYLPLASSLANSNITNVHDVARLESQIKADSKAMDEVKEVDGKEAVDVFFGTPQRLQGVEILLLEQGKEIELKCRDTCCALENESLMAAKRLRKAFDKVQILEKQTMIEHIARSSQDFAKQKDELHQQLAKTRKVFEKAGRELSEEHRNAEKVAGTCMCMVGCYTAVTLYPSSFYGKRSDQGKQTQDV